jgi:hypothetical protein
VPAEGQLPERLRPVPGGWRIRRSPRNQTWRLAPPRTQAVVRVLSWTPYALAAGTVVGLHFGLHSVVWVFWIVSKGWLVKAGTVAATGFTAGRLLGRLIGWYLRVVAGLELTVGSLHRHREGDPVRLRGVVRGDRQFASAVSGLPAVLVHYQVRATDRRAAHLSFDEMRGIDFLVDVPGGATVLVAAAEADITGGAHASTTEPADVSIMVALQPGANRCQETRIAPGDPVEVIGVVSRELDPDGQRTSSRDLPQQLVLRGTRRLPLLVRSLGRRNRP